MSIAARAGLWFGFYLLLIEPVGHAEMRFEPGQFAWLITGRTPFDKNKHPISTSSCACDEPGKKVAFTIKNLGDWSGEVVPLLKPGTRICVDGPYGAFTPDRERGSGYALIGGGKRGDIHHPRLPSFGHSHGNRSVQIWTRRGFAAGKLGLVFRPRHRLRIYGHVHQRNILRFGQHHELSAQAEEAARLETAQPLFLLT